MVSARRQSTDYSTGQWNFGGAVGGGMLFLGVTQGHIAFDSSIDADTERALTRTLYKGRRCPYAPRRPPNPPTAVILRAIVARWINLVGAQIL